MATNFQVAFGKSLLFVCLITLSFHPNKSILHIRMCIGFFFLVLLDRKVISIKLRWSYRNELRIEQNWSKALITDDGISSNVRQSRNKIAKSVKIKTCSFYAIHSRTVRPHRMCWALFFLFDSIWLGEWAWVCFVSETFVIATGEKLPAIISIKNYRFAGRGTDYWACSSIKCCEHATKPTNNRPKLMTK